MGCSDFLRRLKKFSVSASVGSGTGVGWGLDCFFATSLSLPLSRCFLFVEGFSKFVWSIGAGQPKKRESENILEILFSIKN